jgi:hypothetical protein
MQIKKKKSERQFQRKLSKLNIKNWTSSMEGDQIKPVAAKSSGADSSILGKSETQKDEDGFSYSRKSLDSNMIKAKKMRKFQKEIDASDNLKNE